MPVVNLRSNAPYDVYIGRPGRGVSAAQALWGNPYPITATDPRAAVVARLETFLLESMDPVAVRMREQLWTLKERALGCFCAPALCHGDVYLHHAQTLAPNEVLPVGGKRERLTPRKDGEPRRLPRP